MKCPNCGQNMADDAVFCVDCGQRLPKDEKPAPSAQPQAQPQVTPAAPPQQQPAQQQPIPPQPQAQRQPMTQPQGYVPPAAPAGAQYRQGNQYGSPGQNQYQNPNPGGQYGYPQPQQPGIYASGGVPGGIPGGMNELNAPMTVGQYILFFLISMIPLVGFIMLLVWAFSNETNINRKNLARAMLIWTLIAVVLSIISSVVFAAAFAGIMSEFGGSF